jgi:ubiquinone biosynthesis protein UbiJ
MFAPFARGEEGSVAEDKPAQPKPEASAATSAEIAELKAQVSSMQAQLERLTKSSEKS